jgi:UDP-glucose 4-epimerase
MELHTILVTGGAGFIGSHMADRLLQIGFRVVVIDNESTGLRRNVPQGAEYIKGDVRRSEDIEAVFQTGIDAVFHIAGQASNIQSFDDPAADLATNTIGTLNILQACIHHKVTRILYASSMTIYGHPETLPVSLAEAPRPISYYGITKYAAERYVLATAARPDLDFGLNATAFRMFNVYGERQRLDNPYQGAMGFFLGNALKGDPITIHSDGEQTRDFVYISDVVDAWVAALANPASYGKFFNLGFGSAVSINQLVDEILTATGHTRTDYPMRYGPCRPGDQRHMCADITQTKLALNWAPKVTIQDGLSRIITWAHMEMAAAA